MKNWFIAVAALWALSLSGAQAGDKTVLVELFTSQGCSSCPPADALLEELATRDDLVALAFHVDYWDYLGWKDTMGDPAHTDRQKAYARVAGHRSIYTPQMIVGGTEHVVGHKPMAVAGAIEQARAGLPPIALSIELVGDRAVITADPAPDLPGRMVVQLVQYIPRHNVSIKRGENAGRVVTYVNAVTNVRQLGRWDGRHGLRLRANIDTGQAVAVIIQEAGPGRVLAAAVLP